MRENQVAIRKSVAIHKDRRQFFVENKANGDFFEINEPAAEVIERMMQEQPLDEIQDTVSRKFPEEDVDVYQFAEQLRELKLIVDDNSSIEDDLMHQNQRAKRSLWSRIPVKAAKLVFNKATAFIFLSLFIGNMILFAANPSLFPVYTDLFIFDSLAATYLLWFVITTITALFHEFGHILAARAHDLSPKLGVGHRLVNIVMETDLSDVWRLPSRKRYGPYLGGICFDQITLFVLLFIQLLIPGSLIASVAAVGVLQITMTFFFQLCIFMKTDFYYVFENFTGTYNLMENTVNKLARYFPFAGKDKNTVEFDGETKVIRIFAVIYLAGAVLMGILIYYYFYPQFVQMLQMGARRLTAPIDTIRFWDGMVLIIFPLLVLSFLIYSWRRSAMEDQ